MSTPHSLIIQGRGLKRYYKRGSETVKALDGVDIDIHTGEMVAILGPSGSGKTTLVNLLSCLDAPTAGELMLNGRQVAGLGEDKLAGVRRGVPPRPEVLEVFYYCLVGGFQGQLVENARELADLVDALAKEIAPPVKALAPNAYPQGDAGVSPMRRFPWPAVIISIVCIPLLFWLVALNLLAGSARNILGVMAGK